jgi:hypothetical protein
MINGEASRSSATVKAGLAVVVAAAALVGCGSHASRTAAAVRADPPLLISWTRAGDIALGESKARVQQEYGSVGHGFHVLQRNGDRVQGYYQLHRSRVLVTFYGQSVGELGFSTPYYRTKRGFGVGSRIPLGPCHRTAARSCEHRWHGFVFDAWSKGAPCSCWVKVGLGAKSLRATAANFEKPWFFINTRRGVVTGFYFALKFID